MKRTISMLMAFCICSLMVLHVAALQRQGQAPPKKVSQGNLSYDGTWEGKTGQGTTIEFAIEKRIIMSFSVEGEFSGPGCSMTASSTSRVMASITDKAFAFDVPGGPGTFSWHVEGSFTSATTAEGVAQMQFLPGPGAPCSGSVRTSWTARRVAIPQPTATLASPAQTPARPQAPRTGYYISNAVLGEPPGTVRLGKSLRGRVRVERGSEAEAERVTLELYWQVPAGMVTNFATFEVPPPGKEKEVTFEIRVFRREEVPGFVMAKTASLEKVTACLRVVQQHPPRREINSNTLCVPLRVVQ